MPSELTKSVRAALSAFVSSREADGGDIAADILRAIRDESSNLLERQLIWDAFDADPFEFYKDDAPLAKQIRRAKSLMSVLSCSRCTTKDGYCKIDAEVALNRDSIMKDVKGSLKLKFSYERGPMTDDGACDDVTMSDSLGAGGTSETEEMKSDGSLDAKTRKQKYAHRHSTIDANLDGSHHLSKGTRVTYTIDLSRDHGKSERMLMVEVLAPGSSPSVEAAVPIHDGEDDCWEDCDDEGNEDDSVQDMDEASDSSADKDKPACSEQGDIGLRSDLRDRFGAEIDPEVIMNFLSWTRLRMDDSSSIFFLLTFPFYEHEWDLAGFVLDSVFGSEEGSGDEEEDETGTNF